ncbi:hypothetical protein KC887_09910, partial [Candidatus Kaiserbacteria bacterium]|nr:hypothetical protein [Candidatus Kaiserbacteria bacterium]
MANHLPPIISEGSTLMASKDTISRQNKAEALAGICSAEPLTVDEMLERLPLFSRSTVYRIIREHPGFIHSNYPFVPKRYVFDKSIDPTAFYVKSREDALTHRETLLSQREASLQSDSLKTIQVEDSPLDATHFAENLEKVYGPLKSEFDEFKEFSTACRAYANGESSEIPKRMELNAL